ncbi:MAG TPA: hypothetical protein VLR91_00020, partial [Thermodesulfobacteriota bacterium]|nr:hypothetical protein [Thermodesulfobacteriota bacterium]
DPEALIALLVAQNERLRLLQCELFGRSSEKRPENEDPPQLHLFNEAEVAAAQEPAEVIRVPAQEPAAAQKKAPEPAKS